MTCLSKYRGEAEVQLRAIRNTALEIGRSSALHSKHFIPQKDPELLKQEGKWTSGRSGLYGKLVITGTRSLDLSAHNESLYRLCYPNSIK